jgi:hypothetical protein
MAASSTIELGRVFGNSRDKKANFDPGQALENPAFMDFLDKFPDVRENRFDVSEQANSLEVQKRFEVFEMMPRVAEQLKAVFLEKIKKMGTNFPASEMANIDAYLENQVFNEKNYNSVLELSRQLTQLAELPGKIKAKELQLAILGDRKDLVNEKTRQEEKIQEADEKLAGLKEERETWGLVKEKQDAVKESEGELLEAKNLFTMESTRMKSQALSKQAERIGNYLQVFADMQSDFGSTPKEALDFSVALKTVQETLGQWQALENDPEGLNRELYAKPKKDVWNAERMDSWIAAATKGLKDLATSQIQDLNDKQPDHPKLADYIFRLQEVATQRPGKEEMELVKNGYFLADQLKIVSQLQQQLESLKKQPWDTGAWQQARETFQHFSVVRGKGEIGKKLDGLALQFEALETWARNTPVEKDKLEKASKGWRATIKVKSWFGKGQKELAEYKLKSAEGKIESFDQAEREKASLRSQLFEIQTQVFVELQPIWELLDQNEKKIEARVKSEFFGSNVTLEKAFAAKDYIDSIIAAEDDDDDGNPIKLRLLDRLGHRWEDPSLKTQEGVVNKIAERMMADMKKAMEAGGFKTTAVSKITARWQAMKEGLGPFAKSEKFLAMEKRVLGQLSAATEQVPWQVRQAAKAMLKKMQK